MKNARRRSQRRNVIGERVRQARLNLKPRTTQADVSARLATRFDLHVSQSSIAKIEAGERHLLDYEIISLAKVLKTTVSQLFGEK